MKHKTVFTWHRITERWTTGIDAHHWQSYREAQTVSGRRVWLFFLHIRSIPDQRDLDRGCPSECPTGLFCGSLDHLSKNINHTHDNWGRHGMIYWAATDLQKIAELNDIPPLTPKLVNGWAPAEGMGNADRPGSSL